MRIFLRISSLLLLATGLAPAALAQNVGIGTTAPTQTLDVNGQLRVRGLSGADRGPSGTDTRLPVVLPDGTLSLSPPVYSASPDVPGVVGGTSVPDTYGNDIAMSGTTAYVLKVAFANGSQNYSLQIFDVANPSAPVLLGSISTASGANSIAVSGTTAYVVSRTANTLQAFDVANPAAPRLLGTVATNNFPYGVAVRGTRVCVTTYNDATSAGSLQVFDVAAPGTPVALGSIGTGGERWDMDISGTTACVSTSFGRLLRTFNIGGSGGPVLLNSFDTSASLGGDIFASIAVSGTKAYATTYSDMLYVFDVAASGTLTLLGGVATGSLPIDLAVSGSTAYVVNNDGSALQTFDVSTPATPVLLNTIAMANFPSKVAASGTTACVLNDVYDTLQAFRLDGRFPPRVVAVNADGSLVSVPVPGGADFIQNQTATAQAGGFNLSGNGTVGGTLTTGGPVTAGGALTVGGPVTASGALTASGPVTAGGTVAVDAANANTGTAASFLRFGDGGSGEGIGSKRTAGGNQYGGISTPTAPTA